MKKLLFTAALVLSVGAFAQKNITKTVGVPFEISYPDSFKQVEGEQENVVFQIFDQPNDFTLYIIQDPIEDWRETPLFGSAEDVIKHYNSTAIESLERNSALKIGDIRNEVKTECSMLTRILKGIISIPITMIMVKNRLSFPSMLMLL